MPGVMLLMEESAVVPRVLVVQRGLDVDDVEQAVAPDGDAALALLDAETFDAVVIDLALPPLDGWCVLARAASRPNHPRLVAIVGDPRDRARAQRLGAELVYEVPKREPIGATSR
jgi:DNA-binding response OmpR family regulator